MFTPIHQVDDPGSQSPPLQKRQATLQILNSLRCHCQNINNTASTTCRPTNATRSRSEINTCLKPNTTSNTFQQQVSHLATHNPISSLETILATDITIDGHTSFHTTFQVITSQGSEPLHVKVDPGASCSSIPLSCFHKAFPKHFTKSRTLKKCPKTNVDNMVSS